LGVDARLRSAFGLSLLLTSGCSDPSELPGRGGLDRPDQPQPRASAHDDGLERDQDPRVDPSRCSGDELDLLALVGSGLCTIPVGLAQALPGPEQLELRTPARLRVAPGARLEFELVLVNHGSDPLDVDLRLRQFLPLGPKRTLRLVDARGHAGGTGALATDCTLRAMSTEPPPERITVPAHAELAIPAEWYANTRLVDPLSYVGSECPDFPPLAEGRYQSVFVVHGGAGSMLEATVEIEVRAPKAKPGPGPGSASEAAVVTRDR
jgi:hypothetical protein